MKRPSELNESMSIYFFRDGITPTWEDASNKNGGSFILRFEKSKCDKIWEDVLLSLIGSQPDSIKGINGVRVKARRDNIAEIDIWVNDVYDHELLEIQREWILQSCALNEDTTIEATVFSN